MKIVFICTGNTCRSPMAEGYLNSLKIPGIAAVSRGLAVCEATVNPNSVQAARELGFDISHHIPQQFGISDKGADKIICMSPSHREVLISCGTDPAKISVLGNGVSDPYGGSVAVYRMCAGQIAQETDRLVYSGELTGIKVDDAGSDSVKDIAKLERLCFSQPWSENAIAESIAAGTHFFTARADGKTLGYAGISAVADEGYITNIAVRPDFRRRGVATLLIDRIFSFARDKGLSFVSLEVRESNFEAISLYRKLGFNAEGMRRDFYSNPKENAIIMTRRFI